jgi:hypothetical protein
MLLYSPRYPTKAKSTEKSPHSKFDIYHRKKNIYFKEQGTSAESPALKKCIELDIVIPFEELKHEDEEEDVVLGAAGLSKALLKEFTNLLVLFTFNERPHDK